MKKMYSRILVLFMALILIASDGFGQKPVFFVGRDNLGDYASDKELYDSLTAWGYAPEFWNSSDYSTGVGVTYDGFVGMFIAESVDSKAMAAFGTTDDYPLPCINMEGYTVSNTSDRWAWVADGGTDMFQTADAGGTADDLVLVIKDNTHYITEIFNIGDEIPWSIATDPTDVAETRPVSIKEVNVTYSGKLGQMKSHATTNPDFWNLVVVDEMGAGKNKIVQWGLNHNGLNGNDQVKNVASPEFFVLVKRMVEWAFEDAGSGTSVNDLSESNYKLEAYPNPASTELTIKFKSEGFIPVIATLFNITGQQVDMIHKDAVQGNNFIYLNADKYTSGIYHVRLDIDGETAYTKILIR